MRKFTGMLACNALLALVASPLAHSADLDPMMKMWRRDPVFANLDGLNNYGVDFRHLVQSSYKSTWRMGRGFLTPAEQQSQYLSGGLSMPVRGQTAASTQTPQYLIRAVDGRDFLSVAAQPSAEKTHALTFVERVLQGLTVSSSKARASLLDSVTKAE